MSFDVTSQLKTVFDRWSSSPLQLDETTGMGDTAQLAVFLRVAFDDF